MTRSMTSVMNRGVVVAGVAMLLGVIPPGVARAERDVSDRPACRVGARRCVEQVIREMAHRVRGLERRCDHDAVFALLYLRTTETFFDTLDTTGYGEPRSVVREDALFADQYFHAFDAFHRGRVQQVPPAWQIAFRAARDRTVSSSGDALLGFNAHIQRDLPFVLDMLARRGAAISRDDHDVINQVLAQVDATAEIVARLDPSFDDNADPDATFQLIVEWRALAYANYLRLRDAPSNPARAAVAAEIEAYAAGVAQVIAQATALPPGTNSEARDAFCAAQRPVHRGASAPQLRRAGIVDDGICSICRSSVSTVAVQALSLRDSVGQSASHVLIGVIVGGRGRDAGRFDPPHQHSLGRQ